MFPPGKPCLWGIVSLDTWFDLVAGYGLTKLQFPDICQSNDILGAYLHTATQPVE